MIISLMNPTSAIDGAVRLTHLGVLRAQGPEALKFLHGQLTNDMLGLAPTHARLAGFCSAKGRLQASFTVWTDAADEVLMACSASLLPATLKRLSMFVLRSRCKLGDASAEWPLYGIVGDAAARLAADADAWTRLDREGGSFIVLPDAAGLRRGLWAGGPAPSLPPFDLDAWRWLEVQSGLPTIQAETVDRFVPQMLNYELVGGVDFQKGCYPGQEIVARSQYRGTIKRRMFRFDVDAPAGPGDEVFHSADAGQPAGMVVNAAPRPGTSATSVLAEVKLAAMDNGSLHLGSVDGPRLRGEALPYAVPLEPAAAG